MLRAARLLGIEIVSGGLGPHDPREVARLARQHAVRVAIENHPETDPQQVIAAIGQEQDVLGACVDTGWWLTHGYDAAQAIRALGQHVWHIHLKDIRAAGGHETVQLGTGIMDVPAVIAAIKAIGYDGAISIEHEPEHFDPTAEVIAGRELAERLLGL
jgi:sugar phosphate isomerase/epimerase